MFGQDKSSSGQGQISSGQVISYHVSVRSCHVRSMSGAAEVKVMSGLVISG